MNRTSFTEKRDGFCGVLSKIPHDRKTVVIFAEDQNPDSFLVKTAMKWLNRMGVSSMGIGGAG